MKFAHMADLHIGSWREPKLRDLSAKAFVLGLEKCVSLGVDFVLFAGDLFNTSLPAMDALRVQRMRREDPLVSAKAASRRNHLNQRVESPWACRRQTNIRACRRDAP